MYQKMYCLLFNAITDALKMLKKGENTAALHLLTEAQQNAEEIYLNTEE